MSIVEYLLPAVANEPDARLSMRKSQTIPDTHLNPLLLHTLAARGLEEPMRCFLIFVSCDNHIRLLSKYTVTIIGLAQCYRHSLPPPTIPAENPGAPHTLTTNITDPISFTNAPPNHHAHSGSSYPPTSDERNLHHQHKGCSLATPTLHPHQVYILSNSSDSAYEDLMGHGPGCDVTTSPRVQTTWNLLEPPSESSPGRPEG